MAIGRLFHLIHMTGDLDALEAWYDDVFSVRHGFMERNYIPFEKRDASLVTVADTVIEPLAPAFREDGWDAMPLGRFYQRFGAHWHSIAWYADDLAAIWQRCTDNGVRVFGHGGRVADQPPASGILVTHPKDTGAQLQFQLLDDSLAERDLRLQAGWDANWWASSHPLGLRRLAYTTVLARDLSRAKHVWVNVLGGVLLHENFSPLTGTANAYVQLGADTVVELATPTRDGSLAAADMAAHGESHHAAAFRVIDLDRAEQHLTAKGLKVIDRDETTLITHPATTHGAVFRWTTWAIPGDPRI